MNFLKHFLVRYKAWFLALIAPLGGPWAVFAIAVMDAVGLAIPMDPLIAYYVHVDPRRAILYAIMGALGSALGSTVPYLIGYRGGEAFVVKKVGRERFDRIHGFTEKYGDMALIVPCVMPPGFPFKIFELSAGVAEMGYLHFLLSIVCGRLLRFLILAGLVIKFGPEVVAMLGGLFKHHGKAILLVLAAMAVVGLIWWLIKRRRRGSKEAVQAL